MFFVVITENYSAKQEVSPCASATKPLAKVDTKFALKFTQETRYSNPPHVLAQNTTTTRSLLDIDLSGWRILAVLNCVFRHQIEASHFYSKLYDPEGSTVKNIH